MKKIAAFSMLFFLLGILAFQAKAQTTTLILLRHAEKDTSLPGSALMKADPPLTKAGEKRALNLITVLKAYQPDEIYATPFIRTRATVAPLAEKFNLEIQTYDPKNLKMLADQLLAKKGKTIIVAGHSNTTPTLVNLLLGENKYPNLADNEYGKFWIVTITDGMAVAKMMDY